MKILLVHQNYPGQFLHLGPALMAAGQEVLALTSERNGQKTPVRTVRYRHEEKSFSRSEYGLAAHFAEQTTRGEIVAKAADQLKRSGFTPDIVFGHSGWGETLYLGEVWPRARRLVYGEFFYRPYGQDVDFDPEFQKMTLDNAIWIRSRQGAQLLAMNDADAAQSPTHWQASSFPPYLRHKISVIHDGIDTDAVAPNKDARFALPGSEKVLRPGNEVLTFANRNLEPYRGYHVFMRALPKVLEARPNAQVVIVGGDRQSYGRPSQDGQSWKDKFLNEVRDRLDLSRVHFVGYIDYPAFLSLMQVSRVHVYLTYPFVLSWSMLEAMSAGALVVGSNTPPVADVIADGRNGRLVDFFDIDGWSRTLIEALDVSPANEQLRERARQDIIERYDLKRLCLPQQMQFVLKG